MKGRRAVCLGCIFWTAALSGDAGPEPAGARSVSPQDHPEPVHSRLAEVERVRLVLLSTNVTTRRGKPVRGLTPADFTLLEEGIPQEIEFFATEDQTPVDLAFLLDLSGSMRLQGKLSQAAAAIRTFVETLDAGDRFGLIGFADRQVTWITELTADRERFLGRLDVQQALGRTALYDALAASPGLVDQETVGRRAIVLITDGVDNASRLPMLKAVWLARRVNVPIYTMSFIPLEQKLLPKRVRQSLRVLDRFSTETGGLLFPIHRPPDLEGAVARILLELRFQYVIGYYPSRPAGDGSFRAVELETTRQDLTVRTRKGYYADP